MRRKVRPSVSECLCASVARGLGNDGAIEVEWGIYDADVAEQAPYVGIFVHGHTGDAY